MTKQIGQTWNDFTGGAHDVDPPPIVSRVALIQRYRFLHYLSFAFPDATRKVIPVNVGQGQEYVEYLGENQYRIWHLNKHGHPEDYYHP